MNNSRRLGRELRRKVKASGPLDAEGIANVVGLDVHERPFHVLQELKVHGSVAVASAGKELACCQQCYMLLLNQCWGRAMTTIGLTLMPEARERKWDSQGARLRQARDRARHTLAEVAGLLDVSVQAVSYWESGRSSPSAVHLYRLAQLFNVTAEWIMVGGDIDDTTLQEAELSFRHALSELPEEDIEMVNAFIRMMRERRREAGPKEEPPISLEGLDDEGPETGS